MSTDSTGWVAQVREGFHTASLERCRWLEPLHQDPNSLRRLFGALTLMRFMMRAIKPDSAWHEQLKEHIGSFPKTDLVSLHAAGFPDEWQELPIWK